MVSLLRDRLRGRDISSVKDEELIGCVGAFFGEDFSGVRFYTGGVLPYLVPFPYSAVVFGNMINIRRGYERVLGDRHVMAEELFHVIQWRRMGRVRMSVFYLFYHLTRGYAANPIECEAKRRADEFVVHTNTALPVTHRRSRRR